SSIVLCTVVDSLSLHDALPILAKALLVERLNNWFALVEGADILEINNFKSLVQRHQGVILNYFVKGHTNAIAEANNKKINTFIRNNQGLKDKDFFFFRIKNYFC